VEDILYLTPGDGSQNGTVVKAPITFGYDLFLVVVSESACPEDLVLFLFSAVDNEVIFQCVFFLRQLKGRKFILLLSTGLEFLEMGFLPLDDSLRPY
jgi:hypothetical protein